MFFQFLDVWPIGGLRYSDNSQEQTTRNNRQLVKIKESDNWQVFEDNWKLYILGGNLDNRL